MNQYKFPKNSFIGGWIIPESITDKLLELYNENLDKTLDGVIADQKVDKNVKDSKDLSIDPYYFEPPMNEYRTYLQECLEQYLKIYPDSNDVQPFNILSNINIQHYSVGGGFKEYHFENDGSFDKGARNLVFMTYLNTVEDGGTQFYYQDITVPAIKGLTVIWPSYWTHTHKGVISKTQEKTIITGWYSFTDMFNLLDNRITE